MLKQALWKYLALALFLLLLGFIIICCDNSFAACGQKHYIDEQYKIKFKEGDTLVYKSNIETRNFYISLLDSGTMRISQSGTTNSGCYAFYEFEIVAICPLNDSSCTNPDSYYLVKGCKDCPKCMTICKTMSIEPIHRKYKKLNPPTLSYFDLWTDKLTNYDDFKSTFEINNQMYYECYLFNVNSSDISEIYYNYEYGFVGFMTIDNKLFNLILK